MNLFPLQKLELWNQDINVVIDFPFGVILSTFCDGSGAAKMDMNGMEIDPSHVATNMLCLGIGLEYEEQPVLIHWGLDKCPPFSKRHFQMHFLEWKCINFD